MNSWPRYKSFFFFVPAFVIRLVEHDRHMFIACNNKFGTKVDSSSLLLSQWSNCGLLYY